MSDKDFRTPSNPGESYKPMNTEEVLLREVLTTQRELTTATTALVMTINGAVGDMKSTVETAKGAVSSACIAMESTRQEMAGVVALGRAHLEVRKTALDVEAASAATRWTAFRAGVAAFWSAAKTPITVLLSGLGAWILLRLGVGGGVIAGGP